MTISDSSSGCSAYSVSTNDLEYTVMTAIVPRMPYVFLSHAHEDKPFARRLAADLRNAGHSVWIDEAAINIGDSLIEKISAGLREVDFVAAVLSPASVESAWVNKELELASNREINEKRVIVLPLLISDVELPGFLQGKLYGDFRNEKNYDDSFNSVLRALGPVEPPPPATNDDIALLRDELAAVRGMAERHAAEAKRAGEAAYQGKSEQLKDAIEQANAKFPSHAPINRTYAFEVDGTLVTLDYALWGIAKAMQKSTHILEAILSIHNRWTDLENMMEAYDDMIKRQRAEPLTD